MAFDLQLFEPLKGLTSQDTPEGRYYTAPSGHRLASVTTVLGRMMPKDYLDEWRARVGEAEAQRILDEACKRGEAIHLLAERYLLGDPDYQRGVNGVNKRDFRAIKRILDARVGTIYGIELPLFSVALGTAGRSDLAAEFDGVPSIVDFKTSRHSKREEEIQNYFIQATVYGFMMWQIYKIKLPQIVIVMHVDHEMPKVFIKKASDFFDEACRLFLEHKRTF